MVMLPEPVLQPAPGYVPRTFGERVRVRPAGILVLLHGLPGLREKGGGLFRGGYGHLPVVPSAGFEDVVA